MGHNIMTDRIMELVGLLKETHDVIQDHTSLLEQCISWLPFGDGNEELYDDIVRAIARTTGETYEEAKSRLQTYRN